jgi:hypothetical protein
MQFKHLLYFTTFFFILQFKVQAQGVTTSPYGQFGIGDLETQGSALNLAQGGTGIAMFNSNGINLLNAASTAYNNKNVMFDIGFYGQSVSLNASNKSQNIVNGNIQYLGFLFPISKKKWTISTGILPYSNANSSFLTKYSLVGKNQDTLFQYSNIAGGLNEIFLSNAIQLPKGFAIGLTTSLIIGNIDRKIGGITKDSSFLPTTSTQDITKESYRMVEFKPSIYYFRALKNNYNISFGATYSFGVDVGSFNNSFRNIVNIPSSAQSELFNFLYLNNTSTPISNFYNGNAVYTDTLSSNESLKSNMPSQLRLGVCLNKTSKWSVNLDYLYINSHNLKSIAASDIYSSGHKIAVGIEYLPKYNALRGYFKRVFYRAGGYYTVTPMTINATRITENGMSFGLGLPMGRGTGGMLNLSFLVGKRGTTENGLVSENFFRFSVGISISDLWFLKYKED